jgi:hypothetical protein
MGMLLRLRTPARSAVPKAVTRESRTCQIVIFPGVRIERHSLDLAHRLGEAAHRIDVGGIGGGRPRKTS